MGDAVSQEQQALANQGLPGVASAEGAAAGAAAARAAAAASAAGAGGGAGVPGGAGGAGGGGAGQTALWQNSGLCDIALLEQLVILLGRQRPKKSLLLSDLGALLPQQLRHGVKEKGGLRSWLQKYSEFFLVSGQPGKESVTLLLGDGAAFGEGAAVGGAGQGAAPGGAAGGGAESSDAARARVEQAKREEDEENDSAVQLRGLPYRATVGDIRRFLGAHATALKNEHAVQLVLNRDGRPSGFARVQFNNPAAAVKAREALHMNRMELAGGGGQSSAGQGHASTDRYVEVFLYSERPNKLRFKRTAAGDGECSAMGGEGEQDLESLGVSKEDVIKQCREHMQAPGNNHLLLSMLGVALSQSARLYLKKTDQGLKHFLSQFPNEFSVDGAKGREMITYLPTAAGATQHAIPAAPADVQMTWGYPCGAAAAGRPQPSVAPGAGAMSPPSGPAAGRRAAVGGSTLAAGTVSAPGALQGRRTEERAAAGAAAALGAGLATPNMFDDDTAIPQSPNPMYTFTPDGIGGTPRGLAAMGARTPSDWGTPQPFGVHWGAQDPNKLAGGRAGEGQGMPQVGGAGLEGLGGAGAEGADAVDANGLAAFNNWSAWAMPPATYWPPPAMSLAGPWGQGGAAGAGGAGLWGMLEPSALGAGAIVPPPPISDAQAAEVAFGGFGGMGGAASFHEFLTGLPGYQGGMFPGTAPSAATAAAVAAAQAPTGGSGAASTGFAAAGGSTPTAEQLSDSGPPCAVALRGLPFTATEQDVFAFFAKHDVVEHIAEARDAVKMIQKSSGKPSGQAIVQMLSRADAMEVVGVLNGQYMGARYIEVFHHNEGGSGAALAGQPAQQDAGAASSRASSAASLGAGGAAAGPGAANEAGDTGGSGSSGNGAPGPAAAAAAAAAAMSAGAPPASFAAAAAALAQQANALGAGGEVTESAYEALFGYLKRNIRDDGSGQVAAGAAATTAATAKASAAPGGAEARPEAS